MKQRKKDIYILKQYSGIHCRGLLSSQLVRFESCTASSHKCSIVFLSNLVHQVIVTPTVIIDSTHHTGCVYDGKGNLMVETQRLNGFDSYPADPLRSDGIIPTQTITEPAVYMGIITNHYGHFLIESLARANFLLEDHPPVKVLIFHKLFISTILPAANILEIPFIRSIFHRLGWDQYTILVVETPLRVETLYMPEARAIINKWIHPLQQRCYQQISRGAVPSSRVYIARTSDRITNEAAIITIFLRYGFHIVFPKADSFDKDVKKYNTAKIMAGVDGTNLHNVVFAPAGSNMIQINFRHDGLSANQQALCEINQIKSYLIPFHPIAPQQIDLVHLEKELQKILAQIDN